MKAKPWSFDGFVLNDGEGYPDADWVSAFKAGAVLPVSVPRLVQRQGRWPKVSGLNRPGARLFMETVLPEVDEVWVNRRLLLQVLNPEDETPKRFLAANGVPPACATDDVLLAMGPWDVYADDSLAWFVRDLLDQDGVEADVTGAVHFEDGRGDRDKVEFDRGIVIEEGTINICDDPIFGNGTITTVWATGGTNTIAHSTDQVRRGTRSAKCTYQDDAELLSDAISGLTPSGSYTLTCWIWVPIDYDGTEIRLQPTSLSGAVSTYIYKWETGDQTGQWHLLETTVALAADVSGFFKLRAPGVPSAGKFIYADEVQWEEKTYRTTAAWGSAGPGYAWSGTAHGSTSTRTATEVNLDDHAGLLDGNDAFSVELWWQPAYDYDGEWPASENYLFQAYEDVSNLFAIEFISSSNVIFAHYREGGTSVTPVYELAFSAGDWIHIIATVDVGGDVQLAVNGVIRASGDISARDVIETDQMNLGSDFAGANQPGGAYACLRIYDRVLTATEISTLYAQVASQARWVDAIVERIDPWTPGARPLAFGVVTTFVIDEDVRWRSRDGDVAFARLYDDSGDFTVTVDGDDDVWPIINFTPQTAKTTGYAYKRWVPVIWGAPVGASNYPYMLGPHDTAAIVSAAKAQADGDDWRVQVDGVEVDRWFGDSGTSQFNQTATKTWVNLDFSGAVAMTLSAAMLIGDTVTVLDVNEDISAMPSSGTVLIDSEAFVYTGKSDAEKRFTGVTRAAKGTSAAGHSAAATVSWIQLDIWILYGDATATAPTIDDDYEPAFDLGDSSNTSWDYEEFGEDDGLRAGQWIRQQAFPNDSSFELYGGNRGASADPWVELGIGLLNQTGREYWGRYYLYNPCGITAANFTSGEKYTDSTAQDYTGEIQSGTDGSSWSTEYSVPVPSADSTWESWSRNETLDTGSIYVALYLDGASDNPPQNVEAADCVLTLDSTYTPTHTINSEQGNYDLAVTILNGATNESILLERSIELGETLRVDVDAETVTYLFDGSRSASPRTVEGTRDRWLRLVEGENVLTISDTGTAELEIDVIWDRRYFE